MFTPFARRESKEGGPEKPAVSQGSPAAEDIDVLKRQIEEMQRKIDKISDKE
jgi:polyhydroxyalkanoate synthesis regulator protein